MNRIQYLLQSKKTNILSVYFTAGFPDLDDTIKILRELEAHGADMVEIGMPFSDPLADGPVIQQSSQRALENGMGIRYLLNQLKNIRDEVKIPMLLMGYLNPVLQYGMSEFLHEVAEIGMDGLILPDLPLEVYEAEYKSLFEKEGISNIFLITPQTKPERIQRIDSLSNAFIYMVSVAATTGTGKNIFEANKDYFDRVNKMQLQHPRLIGFGIHDRKTFEVACQHAAGAIIGTAFIRALAEGFPVAEFLHSIQNKTGGA